MVSGPTPATINPGETSIITVTAKDPDGNTITTGGEYFRAEGNYMIDNGDGTYSYSRTFSSAGEFTE